MQMLVSLQKLSWGMELIRTVMTDPLCRRGCILSRIYKKQLKAETAESWSLSVYVYHLRYGSNKANLPSTELSFPQLKHQIRYGSAGEIAPVLLYAWRC